MGIPAAASSFNKSFPSFYKSALSKAMNPETTMLSWE
jgi:hypothetical protein